MKRVRINKAAKNHNEAFDKGVRQLVRNKNMQGTTYPDYELNAIMRYELETADQTPRAQPRFGFTVADLLQEVIWSSRTKHQQ